jgi:IS30 family transposase
VKIDNKIFSQKPKLFTLLKGTDFSKVTLASIKKVQDMLNDRPRKTLGFLTPHEVFSKLLH